MTWNSKIENVQFYNRIFDIYTTELELGDLKNIDGDYLVASVYWYLIRINESSPFDDGSIQIWLYKVYAADKETLINRENGIPQH